MAGRTISGYVDERIADRLNSMAKAEERSPARIVGQALNFYVSLPESARNSLRRIDAMASSEEVRWFQSEFMRLLFKVDMGITQRKMAEEMGVNLPSVKTEEESEQASIEWMDSIG